MSLRTTPYSAGRVSAPSLPRPLLPYGSVAFGNWAVSLLFALFVAFLPWEIVRGEPFADLVNYATRMTQIREHGMDYFTWEDSIRGWLTFEYFWFRLLVTAAYMGIEPVTFMKAVTLVASFLTHRFLAARVGSGTAFLVLANPITIDLLSSQTRSAFAFALFLTLADWLVARRHVPLRYVAFAALPFIHTATLAVVGIYSFSLLLGAQTWVRPLLKMLAVVALALVFVFVVVVMLPGLAQSVGDRRDVTGYQTKTLAYLAFWFLTAGALAISYSPEACKRWEYLFALFICASAPLIEALGRPGFRFVALAIPLVWIAIGFTRGWVRRGIITAAIGYLGLLYYYWIG